MSEVDESRSPSDLQDPAVTRSIHLTWSAIGLVFVGGSLGTAARAGIGLVAPTPGGLPVATMMINIVGALVLGFLIETLARRGPDVGSRRALRLFGGTGVLGGFTTYSALSTDTASLINSHLVWALGYSLITVIVGALASITGIRVARALGPDAVEERP